MRVLAVTGTSGGHIFPALALLDSIKKTDKNNSAILLIAKNAKERNLEKFGYPVSYISITTIRKSLSVENIISILNFFKSWIESFLVLVRFKPDIIVGFGTLSSVPVIMLAWLFRIKTMIHEQNVLPGRANRFLSRFVDKVAISFNESRFYFKASSKKITFTGNPLRKELKLIDKDKALDFFGFDRSCFTVLVMGGSQGSHNINTALFEALNALSQYFQLQVIHLSGAKDYNLLQEGYKKTNIRCRIFPFLEEMQYAYSAADLLISRSGATTISEAILYKIPAVLIPYPYAYRHQLNNAEVLKGVGTAVIVDDNSLNSGILTKTLKSLLSEKAKLEGMRFAYNNIQIPIDGDILTKEAIALNGC